METPGLKGLGLYYLSTPTLTPATLTRSTNTDPIKHDTCRGISDWTPPISPVSLWSIAPPERYRQIDSASLADVRPPSDIEAGQERDPPPHLPTQPLRCQFEVEMLRDVAGKEQIFGAGAWSTVYKAAIKRIQSTSVLLTPPTSPMLNPPTLIAIKCPINKQAQEIIKVEAQVLTHLSRCLDHEKYIVPFHGILPVTNSLVLAALPLSLDDYITSRATAANASATTWFMSSPAIGSTKTWLRLAHDLITALGWLHDTAHVIHGDIKPSNILLLPAPLSHPHPQQQSTFPYTPLLTDFSSSSHLHASPQATNPNALSALTLEYTAPELLTSKVLSNPLATATRASDVFSLAVTLLVAATGDVSVYGRGVSAPRRRAMATQGWGVLGFVRGSEVVFAGARVPRSGVVERGLERAVLRAGFGRVGVEEWRGLVEGLVGEVEGGGEEEVGGRLKSGAGPRNLG